MLSFSFLWEIENARSLFYEDITGHPAIYSSEFSVNDNDQYAFKLEMYPKGDTEERANNISLYLNLTSKLLTKSMVLYRFSIVDCKAQKFNSRTARGEITKTTGNGFGKYITREAILNSTTGLLVNEKFTILCEGEVIADADGLSESILSSRYEKFCKTSYVHSAKSCFKAMRSIPFSLKWEIDNYRNQSQIKNCLYIESLQYFLTSHNEYKFKLRLYPKGFGDKNQNFLTLFLCNDSISSNPLLIQFKFSMIDINGQKYNTKSTRYTFGIRTEQNSSWGWFQYFKHDDIYKENLIQNDTLTVVCEGEIILNGDSLTELDLENYSNIFKNKQTFQCAPIAKTNNKSNDEDFPISKFKSLNLKNDI